MAAAPALASDRDDDGLDDAHDRCPDAAEDFDVFEDDDGCPDPDDDRDGVLDDDDACPYDAGPTKSGCRPKCVIVTDIDDCFISDALWFEGGVPASDLVADAVAVVLANPNIRQVTVSGYRGAGEPAGASMSRALKIRDRFIAAGVAESLVVAIDSGVFPAPLASARRVHALITEQRFSSGRFRATECTIIGPIYKPARATYHCP